MAKTLFYRQWETELEEKKREGFFLKRFFLKRDFSCKAESGEEPISPLCLLLPGFQEDCPTHKWMNNIKNRLLKHPTREQGQKYPTPPEEQFLAQCGSTSLFVLWETFLPHFIPKFLLSVVRSAVLSSCLWAAAQTDKWSKIFLFLCQLELFAAHLLSIRPWLFFSRNISRCWSRGAAGLKMGEFSLAPKHSCSLLEHTNPFFLARDPQKKHKFSVPFPQEPCWNVGLLVLFSFPPQVGISKCFLKGCVRVSWFLSQAGAEPW